MDSIIKFLDNENKKDCSDMVPSRILEEKCKYVNDLKFKILDCRKRIKWLYFQKKKIDKIKNKYQTMVLVNQAEIDRWAAQKVKLINKIKKIKNKLDDYENEKDDVGNIMCEDCPFSLKNEELVKIQNEIMEEMIQKQVKILQKVNLDFQPQINELISQHKSKKHQMEEQFSQKIDLIKSQTDENISKELMKIRNDFREQLDKDIKESEKGILLHLEKLQNSNQKEILKFEHDLDFIQVKIHDEIEKIKKKYSKCLEDERKKFLIEIKSYQMDSNTMKKMLEVDVQHFTEFYHKNMIKNLKLVDTEMVIKNKDKNQIIIQKKKVQLQNQMNLYKQHLNDHTEKQIQKINLENNQKSEILRKDILFLKKEIEKQQKVFYIQHDNQKNIDSKKHELQSELESIKSSISLYQDRLFNLKQQKIQIQNTNYQSSVKIIRKEFIDLKQRINIETQVHQNEMNSLKHDFFQIINETSQRIKSVITEKDKMINNLKQQILQNSIQINLISESCHQNF